MASKPEREGSAEMTTKNGRVVLNLSEEQARKLKSLLEATQKYGMQDAPLFDKIAKRIEKTLNKPFGREGDKEEKINNTTFKQEVPQ